MLAKVEKKHLCDHERHLVGYVFVYGCVPHLEVRLCEYAGELSCSVGAVCERVQVPEDLLQELHVVIPHRRQTRLLQALLLLLTHKNTQTDK